MISKSLTLL